MALRGKCGAVQTLSRTSSPEVSKTQLGTAAGNSV